MATKMCFAVGTNAAFEERIIEFEYIKGMAFSQKQKNVLSFHKSIQKMYPDKRIIEISTKSPSRLGVDLSAFNLKLDGYPLECVFQASKIFVGNIQFKDLLFEEPNAAKKYIRENVALPIIGFEYKDDQFETIPRSMFYDYIYISAILQSELNTDEIADYDIFTDIEFNEKKAYNCQARACAIYAYLLRTKSVKYYMASKENFKKLYNDIEKEQLSLSF